MVKQRDEDGKEIEVESTSYKTHNIRCKGASKVGKIRKLQFGQDAMDAIRKWLEVRGDDDCPYVFTCRDKDGIRRQVSENVFGNWCKGLFTEIMGKRVNCHIFRESRATNIVVKEGKPIETAQKLLGHASSSTTSDFYVIRDDMDDADDAFI